MNNLLKDISENEIMCQEIGEQLVELLNLRQNKNRVGTTSGSKTLVGLTRTILNIIQKSNVKRTNTINLLESNEEV